MKNIVLFLSIVALMFIASCRPSGEIVRVRPEAPAYVRHAAPGAGYVWADGDWVWQRNRYVYRQGYYIQPRPNRSSYIAGHWERRRHGWIWISGQWR
ncbi:MAG: hypothetical protein ACMG51_03320 [Ginsengibacter sp.]